MPEPGRRDPFSDDCCCIDSIFVSSSITFRCNRTTDVHFFSKMHLVKSGESPSMAPSDFNASTVREKVVPSDDKYSNIALFSSFFCRSVSTIFQK